MPSPSDSRRPRKLGGLLRVALLSAPLIISVALLISLFVRSRRAEARTTQITSALDRRARSQASLAKQASDLHSKQVGALSRLKEIEEQLEPKSCDEIVPQYRYGVGILQVASVPESRGSDTIRFAAAQRTRLHTLFANRGLPPSWGMALTQYRGQEKEPVRRVAFNNIDPVSGAAMCAWLRCEKWTGGCAFIDERGAAHPSDAAPSEYEPAEDLYQLWRVATINRPTNGG